MLLSVGRWYFTILVIPPKAFIFKERLSERFASSDYNVLKNKPAPASVISSPAPQRISLCFTLKKTDGIQRFKPQAIITFSPTHTNLGTAVQTQHHSGNKNSPTTKGGYVGLCFCGSLKKNHGSLKK